MSQMAQKIDEDNQILMKKNQELKIQYLSQENDRELLLQQIIHYKKESQKIKEQHEALKRKVEEARSEERHQEEMLSHQNKPDYGQTVGGHPARHEIKSAVRRPPINENDCYADNSSKASSVGGYKVKFGRP